MSDAPSLRLSVAELCELAGCRSRRKLFAWCAENGIPAVPDAAGRPCVLRAAVEARLLPKGATRTPKRTEPDLGALRGRKAA